MEFQKIVERALEVRAKYAEMDMRRLGREWTNSELMQGFVVDIGELMELVMAKEGTRGDKNGDLDKLLKEELSDCLWCLIVLAKRYNIELDEAFMQSMDTLDKRVDEKLRD